MNLEEVNASCKYLPANCPKKPYRNRAIAERKLRELQASGRREASCYKCPFCGRWHTSSLEEGAWKERDRGQGGEAANFHMHMKGEPL